MLFSGPAVTRNGEIIIGTTSELNSRRPRRGEGGPILAFCRMRSLGSVNLVRRVPRTRLPPTRTRANGLRTKGVPVRPFFPPEDIPGRDFRGRGFTGAAPCWPRDARAFAASEESRSNLSGQRPSCSGRFDLSRSGCLLDSEMFLLDLLRPPEALTKSRRLRPPPPSPPLEERPRRPYVKQRQNLC